jgi:peroxiredoxin
MLQYLACEQVLSTLNPKPYRRKVYLQFGIDVPKHNGDVSWTLPMAARFIIDRSGIVRYAEVTTDHTVRPEPEDTIAALKEIQS